MYVYILAEILHLKLTASQEIVLLKYNFAEGSNFPFEKLNIFLLVPLITFPDFVECQNLSSTFCCLYWQNLQENETKKLKGTEVAVSMNCETPSKCFDTERNPEKVTGSS